MGRHAYLTDSGENRYPGGSGGSMPDSELKYYINKQFKDNDIKNNSCLLILIEQRKT